MLKRACKYIGQNWRQQPYFIELYGIARKHCPAPFQRRKAPNQHVLNHWQTTETIVGEKKSFCLVDAGDGVIATISIFQSDVATEQSSKAAANWVKENLSEFNPTPRQITAGRVKIDKTA